MGPGLVIDPIETSLDRESRQHPVLGAIPIARRYIDSSSLVVQGLGRVAAVFIPALCHSQLHSRPLVHHRDRQCVELLLAPL